MTIEPTAINIGGPCSASASCCHRLNAGGNALLSGSLLPEKFRVYSATNCPCGKRDLASEQAQDLCAKLVLILFKLTVSLRRVAARLKVRTLELELVGDGEFFQKIQKQFSVRGIPSRMSRFVVRPIFRPGREMKSICVPGVHHSLSLLAAVYPPEHAAPIEGEINRVQCLYVIGRELCLSSGHEPFKHFFAPPRRRLTTFDEFLRLHRDHRPGHSAEYQEPLVDPHRLHVHRCLPVSELPICIDMLAGEYGWPPRR